MVPADKKVLVLAPAIAKGKGAEFAAKLKKGATKNRVGPLAAGRRISL
jgi:hypothetical protein